jgi:hypothetical protein
MLDAHKRFRALRAIWLALVLSVVAYGAVSLILLTFGGMDLRVVDDSAARPITLGIILYMIGALVVRRRLVEAIPTGLDEAAYMARYQPAVLVGLALIEAGGVASATLGLLADGPEWVVAGCGSCVIVLLLARPKPAGATTGHPRPR